MNAQITAPEQLTATQIILRNTSGTSNKEYRIALEISNEPRVVTQWGRIGFVNRSQVREFGSASEAASFAQQLAEQQNDKGYWVQQAWKLVELTTPVA